MRLFQRWGDLKHFNFLFPFGQFNYIYKFYSVNKKTTVFIYPICTSRAQSDIRQKEQGGQFYKRTVQGNKIQLNLKLSLYSMFSKLGIK